MEKNRGNYYLGFEGLGLGFPKITGTFLGGPYNKDCILGSILKCPNFGKLP